MKCLAAFAQYTANYSFSSGSKYWFPGNLSSYQFVLTQDYCRSHNAAIHPHSCRHHTENILVWSVFVLRNDSSLPSFQEAL